MKIVFMGTPDFSVSVLEALSEKGHEIKLVITQPDRPGNRGRVIYSPVKRAALSMGLDVIQPENVNSEDVLKKIREASPDAGVCVAYGQILKKDILSVPKYGILNVHASLLPRLRGASPMQRAILDGDEETGVTIMKVAEGLDTGDMILKGSTKIGKKNFEEIHDELAKMGAELINEALSKIEKGEAVFEKQDDSLATYAGLIKKSDGKIDFSRPAAEIERKIRAFDPWPGAFSTLDGDTIKIWNADVLDAAPEGEPGEVSRVTDEGIIVSCGEGELLIKEIQLPGKRRVTVKDFLLGHDISPGAKFV